MFHVAVGVRAIAGGKGFRVFQLRKPKNRHLVDVRQIEELPPTQLVAEVRVPLPEELITQKVISLTNRRGQPKADTDRRDVKMMLLAFPELQIPAGAVLDRLNASLADEYALREWQALATTEIVAEEEDW